MKLSKNHKIVLFLLSLLSLMVFIKTAWFCDDSYITFRTVDNFINGLGLRWNISDRVQVYTHPLWMMLVSLCYYFTREIYFTVMVLSLILTAFSLGLATKLSKTFIGSVFILAACIFSRSFVDFVSGGLENPLVFFLLAFYLWRLQSTKHYMSKVFELSIVASLLLITRQDLVLLIAPSLLFEISKVKSLAFKIKLKHLFLGAIPFIAWEFFSLFYYGYAVPNTAFAKLNTGIPSLVLLKQGVLYLINIFANDPITVICIVSALFLIYLYRTNRNIFLAIGILLYLIYLLKVGGDYMGGRFLSFPFFISVIIIGQMFLNFKRNESLVYLGSAILVGLCSPHPTILSGVGYGEKRDDAISGSYIVDERNAYYADTGLLTYQNGMEPIRSPFYWQGEQFKKNNAKVVEFPTVGFAGFAAGPKIHIVDHYALADPLLSKLPIRKKEELGPSGWRIGHFAREIPCGYIATLESGTNKICDPNLAHYYEKVRIITIQNDLWSVTRVKTIVLMNLGYYDKYISLYVKNHPEIYDFDKSI